MRLGIDLMGSESSPFILFEAVFQAAEHFNSTFTFVVLGQKQIIDDLHSKYQSKLASPKTGRIEFHAVEEVITMGDVPLEAVRRKKNSSLMIGIKLLKKHHIEALVTTGNTGALIAGATLYLPMLPGINRPALLTTLPTKKGGVAVIDVGGNVYCKAHHLVQFAHMGAVYQRCRRNIECPAVGLLNIGVESKKGTVELRQAYQTLQDIETQRKSHRGKARMRFIGNMEGRDIFDGKADVLVTDGFTGNVLLKTAEGAATYILNHFKGVFKDLPDANWKSEIQGLQKLFHYAEYPGAIVCGIEGIVVKCHGNSSSRAFYNGILGAISLVEKQLVKQIKADLTS